MAGYLLFWYRRTKKGETKYHDVSRFVKKISNDTLVKFKKVLNKERATFDVWFSDIEDATDGYTPFSDSNDVEIFPEIGDDIVVTDESMMVVFENICGNIIDFVPDNKGDWKPDSICIWKLKIRHRDPSLNYFEVNETTIVTSTFLLDTFINNNTKEFLGGIMPDGTVVPPYTEQYNPIDVPAYKYAGITSQQIEQMANNMLGLYTKTKHFVRPDTVNNIKLLQTIDIFDRTGDSNIPADWIPGITNQSLIDGEIPNNKFSDYETTPDEPETILTESDFKIEVDGTGIKNIIRLNGWITDGLGTVTFQVFEQVGQKVTFETDFPGIDVLYCARLVDCKILSITSATVFTIDVESAEKIAYDEARLDNTTTQGWDARLVMRIKSGGIWYIKNYNISGQTITLDAATAENPDIPALLVTDTCQHVNGYNVLEEGLDTYPADDQGYVIKKLKWGEKTQTTFTEWDKPNELDSVIVGYLALESFRLPYIYEESRMVNDAAVVTEEFNFPITREQYQTIANEYKKLADAQIIISFRSERESVIEIGWRIFVYLIYKYKINAYYFVDSVTGRVVTQDGRYNGKPTVIMDEVIMRLYRDDLADFLKRFKNQYALLEKKLKEKPVKKIIIKINIAVNIVGGFAIPAPGAPTGLHTGIITSSSVAFLWDDNELATSWEYEVSKYPTYIEKLTGYNAPSPVTDPAVVINSIFGSFTSGNTLYFRLRSRGPAGATSEWVSTSVVVTPSGVPSTGLLAYYTFDNTLVDNTGHYTPAILHGAASVGSGKLDIGNNNNDYAEMSVSIINGLTDYTFAGFIKFDVLSADNCWLSGEKTTQTNACEIYYDTPINKWSFLHNGTNYFFAASTIPNDLAEHHTAITKSGTTSKLYIDATLISTITFPAGAISIDNFMIGQDTTDSGGPLRSSLKGKTRENVFYNRALSGAEITALYNATL